MLTWILTGGGVLFLLILCGSFFLIYLRGLPFKRPVMLLKILFEKEGKGDSPAKATFLALAGTLGVGNLVGVANAIALGGAGAIFWMWVSSLFAMILKYAEILLAVLHKRRGESGFYGGAAYYMSDLWQKRGCRRLSHVYPALFSFFLLLNSFSMGSMIQVGAIATSLESAFRLPPILCGLLLVALVIPLAAKGQRKISTLTSYLVPIMSLGLILLSAFLLILRRAFFWEAVRSIFASAFSKESFAGGIFGFLTSSALRVGTMRGLLSNEAGCGTSPTAHATSSVSFPAKQGVWGIFEVFVDTLLLCSLSALVILSSGADLSETDGMALTLSAYSHVLGKGASIFLSLAVFVFGYATLICWVNYGLESVRFFSSKKRWKALYLTLFALSILCGSVILPRFVWGISDFAIAGLTVLNLCSLFFLRREVRKETLLVFQKPGRGLFKEKKEVVLPCRKAPK